MSRRGGFRVVPWLAALVSLLIAFPALARPLDEVKESGAIALCANPNALPFSAKEGPRRGFEVEMGAVLARAIGVAFATHWTVASYDLNRADCDFVLDAIADPEAQAESRLKLSKPYGSSGITLAVRGDEAAIRGLGDLRAPRIKVGILPGSMAAMYLGQHGIRTAPAGFESDLLNEVAAGELTAAAVTPAALGYYNLRHRQQPLRLVDAFADAAALHWNLAVGVVKPDAALLAAINRAIDKLTAQGAIQAIYRRYGVTLAPPR